MMILRIGSDLVGGLTGYWVNGLVGYQVNGLTGYRVFQLNRITRKPINRQTTKVNPLNPRTRKPANPLTPKAFTLVELLISVVILGFGLCVVIRSYMSSLSALDTSQNYIEASRFTQTKLSELELSAVEKKGLEPFLDSGEALIGVRKASWKIEVRDIQEPEEVKEDLVMAQVSVNWQERNAPRSSALVTYLPKYKEDEEEKKE